jgi:hypothetical protein
VWSPLGAAIQRECLSISVSTTCLDCIAYFTWNRRPLDLIESR